ncbi:MAG TPA: amidohydrolase family protein [Terriglobia bacterium]|nr:amidohydrolase family protein [Terriglobia bacterium]
MSVQLRALSAIVLAGVLAIPPTSRSQSQQASSEYEFNDSHFHLTNYIQEGPSIREFLKMMGGTVGRSTLFGIPLQQQWSYRISADNAPTYYLQTDAPLYYYSFTDAAIATAYLSLTQQERTRFDPLITGFNPSDMYGADHIRRVLLTFPGVFCGIGEFTIHKEFVSSKTAGGPASLFDPAVDRVLGFAEEAGLVALIHNDVDIPFAKPEDPPAYLDGMKALLRQHPGTTIIWAHMGVGRVVRPISHHTGMIENILQDPGMRHVMFDISWDEVAKYVVASPESLKLTADLINKYPDRFLFGTDSLAPKDEQNYLKTYHTYAPLWPLLTKDASVKVRKDNYTRTFDEATRKVRAWEAMHVPGSQFVLPITR